MRLLVVAGFVASAAPAQTADPEEAVARARLLREEQRYREALAIIEPLAIRAGMPATARVDALREIGLLRLILRDAQGARDAFAAALGRDPGFDLGPDDYPPHFRRALDEARAEAPPPVPVRLGEPRARIDGGHAVFEVDVVEGSEVVASVVVSHREAGDAPYATLSLGATPPYRAQQPVRGPAAEYFVEARAPSGAVLARAGSAEEPLVVQAPPPPVSALAPSPAALAPAPRAAAPATTAADAARADGSPRRTWLWVAGGTAVAAGVAVALVVLLKPDAPRDGDAGTLELGR